MFVLDFHGGTGHDDINNLHAYDHQGRPADPAKLLAHGGGAPDLSELRGFAWRPEGLYVVNGNKDASQLLLYQPAKGGQFAFARVVASKSSVNGILHPFDVAFDASGNIYLSSQDTNVVTALDASGKPLPAATYLQQAYPSGAFLAGTQVASSSGALPLVPGRPPPDVPLPEGLGVGIESGKVQHSVRGVVWVGGCLLVADEAADAVKVYAASGQLQGQISGGGLTAPVHLLLWGETLYISSGNDAVYTCPIPGGKAPMGVVAPTAWLTRHLRASSGMCFGADGNFYVALRKDKEVRQFSPKGDYLGTFLSGLDDEPEFIACPEGTA